MRLRIERLEKGWRNGEIVARMNDHVRAPLVTKLCNGSLGWRRNALKLVKGKKGELVKRFGKENGWLSEAGPTRPGRDAGLVPFRAGKRQNASCFGR